MDLKESIFLLILLKDFITPVLCQCSGSALTLSASESPTKFLSPGYPVAYTNNLFCQWLIDSGVAGQPVFLYSDHLNMDCAYGDFVNIYDGSSTAVSKLHNNLCDTDLVSTEYISTGRYVLVTMTTNAVTVSQGFEMTYFTAADTSATGCTSEYVLSASTIPRYLTSQGFPAKYASNSACRWLIQASTTLSTLNIELVWSDVEEGPNCAYDKLVIYDGRYVCENKELVIDCTGRTSANATSTVYISSGDYVLVTFNSDSSFNRYGFIIKYSENFVNYTTTTVALSTSAVTVVTSGNSETNTRTEISIPIMVASAVAGAVFVLGILALVWLMKYIKSKKKVKKGLIHVHAIAPLPARTMFTPRQPTNVLSFV